MEVFLSFADGDRETVKVSFLVGQHLGTCPFVAVLGTTPVAIRFICVLSLGTLGIGNYIVGLEIPVMKQIQVER